MDNLPEIDGIQVLLSVPEGFIPTSEFCERAGVTKPVLTVARKRGQFDMTGIVYVKKGKARAQLYYSEDKVVQPFLDEREYSPKVAAHKAKKVIPKKKGTPPPPPPSMYTPPPSTQESDKIKKGDTLVEKFQKMKLHKEEVDLETKNINLRRMKNEDVPMEEVLELMETVAIETLQALKAITPRVGAVFAAENDPVKIMNMIDKEHEVALEGLGKTFERYRKQRKQRLNKKRKVK